MTGQKHLRIRFDYPTRSAGKHFFLQNSQDSIIMVGKRVAPPHVTEAEGLLGGI